MSIQRIKSLGNIDAFDTLDWTGKALARLNLIYGWNGCGKTTVSRVFRFVERKAIDIAELASVQYHIESITGALREGDVATSSLPIKVFNQDFIADNVEFRNSRAKKILIVGKEN